MSAPIHVVHLVLSLDCGGLERVVLDLAGLGSELDQRVSIVCLEQAGSLRSQAEARGVQVLSLGKRPGLRPLLVGRLKRLWRALAPDVLHSHQIGALFYGGPAARAAAVPVVVHTEHGKHYAQRRRTRWLGRFAARAAGRFFCVSQDIATEVCSCRIAAANKVRVLANGIDTQRFVRKGDTAGLRRQLGIPAGAPVVGTVGRLTAIKRQDRLLRAFAHGVARLSGSHLVLVGDGPLLADLQRLSFDLSIADRVHFVGQQAHPEQFLALMDVFALTSSSEGMPLAVLEAGAAGVPVVATRVGGLPEMIEEGVTGRLVDPDDERGLAAVLCELLENADRARHMGEAGRRRAQSLFDLRVMAGAYNAHYRELLGKPCASS
jgi:glycosyltransferase involved in cell wall biosynthesis